MASIETINFPNGNIKQQSYTLDGKLHRTDDNPAKIKYYENGNIKSEQYWIDGEFHRTDDKPAVIKY